MLRAVIEKNKKRMYFDFCDGFIEIENKLSRISINKSIMTTSIGNPDIHFHFTNDSGGLFHTIREMVKESDTLYDILYACNVAYNADKGLTNYLQQNIDKKELTKVRDFHLAKQIYQYHLMNDTEPIYKRTNANEKTYQQIKLFGKIVLFTPSRIDRTTVPEELFLYEVMHDDECQGIMCSISRSVMVNFWGTVISNDIIPLDRLGYRDIDEDRDVKFLDKESISLQSYIKNNSLKKTEKER